VNRVAATERVGRQVRIAVWAMAATWAAVLAILWSRSTPPVLINGPQIAHADWVLLGEASEAEPSRIRVQQAWKAAWDRGDDVIVDGLADVSPPRGPVIVPVSEVDRGRLQVTQGVLPHPKPASRADGDRVTADPPRLAQVRPAVYPAHAELQAVLTQQFGPPQMVAGKAASEPSGAATVSGSTPASSSAPERPSLPASVLDVPADDAQPAAASEPAPGSGS
jgi:hypothetical protein